MILDRQIRSGLGWFYWIAGLSLINSITYLFELESSFVVGLGVTQLIDALALAIAQESTAEIGLFLRVIGYAFDLALIVAFVLFGIFGRKRVRWVIITGMVLYALDTILVLVFQDWFSALFHVLALWGIWTGLRAIKHLAALETSLPASFPVTAQSAYSTQTAIAPERPGMNRVILVILLVVMLILVAITLVRVLAP
jgi:hypothetical protein